MNDQRQALAAEYDRLAAIAITAAELATLDQVREKHLRAAAAWSGLALTKRGGLPA